MREGGREAGRGVGELMVPWQCLFALQLVDLQPTKQKQGATYMILGWRQHVKVFEERTKPRGDDQVEHSVPHQHTIKRRQVAH